jgi:hypothetical protein
MKESNKDFFTILKVDYSTLLNFMKVQMSINLTNTHFSINLLISISTSVKNKNNFKMGVFLYVNFFN